MSSLFRLVSLLALCDKLNLFFPTCALALCTKITKVTSFESITVLRKDLFLVLFVFLSSSTISCDSTFRHLYHTLSFSAHKSSLKAKFFLRLMASSGIFASSWGPSKESLALLNKDFFRPVLIYTSPRWFTFLSVIKLESFHRADSRAITACLSFCPVRLLFLRRPYHLHESPDSFCSVIL